MIQRIQSVYLLLAAFVMGILFFQSADLIRIQNALPEQLNNMEYLNDQVLDVYDQKLLIALAIVAIIFSFITVFLFRNRKLQITLSRFTMFIVLLFFLFAFYLAYTDLNAFLSSLRITPAYGLFLPVASIVLLILAVQGIRKDEKLVKSMDRLR